MAARRPARSTSSKPAAPRATSPAPSRGSAPASASAPASSRAASAGFARAARPAPAPAPRPDATFAELGVPRALTDLLAADGITAPFPIQAATLPDSLAGRDVLGRGRTGSGKTLGFLLPVLIRLSEQPRKRTPNRPRALILAPTRELATQIHSAAEPLAKALGLRTTAIFGGVATRPQISALRSGLDLVVACPGRLLDHVDAGHADLGAIEITVLDEADHMADLGFLPMVKRILDGTPKDAQRLLFSATLDNGIDALVRRYLSDPVTHSVDTPHSEVPEMTHHVLHIDAADRLPILVELTSAPGRTIVFTRTKHGARKLARQLLAARVPAVDLHGNLAQSARTRNLAAFAEGRATTLVATDIAARGIHVDEVALVVHADPPVEHKAYLHRSGRTARAGNSGTVVTLMTDAQTAEVRELTRKARITATTTRLAPGNPLLETLAPGERSFAGPELLGALTGEGRVPRQAGASGAAPSTAATSAAGKRGGGARVDGGGPGSAGEQGGGETAPRRRRPRRRGAGAGAGKEAGNARRGTAASGGGKAGAGTGTSAEAKRGDGGRTAAASSGNGSGSAAASRARSGGGRPARPSKAASPTEPGGAARASQSFRGRGGRSR